MAKELFSFEEALGNTASNETPAKEVKQKPSAQQRTLTEDIGRQVGLTARGAVSGLVSLPALAADALIAAPLNAGLAIYDDLRAPTLSELVSGKKQGFRFPRQAAAIDKGMTQAGLPEPENAQERVVQDVVSGMAGTGGTIKAGQALANSGGALAKGIGETLAAGPKLQIASAASGAGAAGATHESGGSEGAQVAAGVLGSLVPALAPAAGAAAARGVIRGGEAGRQKLASNVATFEAAGVQPTLGQAAGGKLQRMESLVAKAPGGAGVIAEYANKQADDMAASVQKLSDSLAPGANAMQAGDAIASGIKSFKQGFQAVQRRLYSNLDEHIPAGTMMPAERTQAALADLNSDIAGAPELSRWFKNARIQGIEGGLKKDTSSLDAVLSRPGMKQQADQLRAQLQDDVVRTTAANVERKSLGMGNLEKVKTPQDIEDAVNAFLTKQVDSRLPYESIKKLRTLVGNEISDGSLVADVPRSKWQALYAALSEDLGVAAKGAGPKAEQAWRWANTYTKTQLERLDQLSGIVSKDSPEKIFNAAISGTVEGDTVISRVVSALPKQERREVAAAVIQRMGRATGGQQNAMGDAFSSETFLSNLSKLSPASRKAIFGRTDLPGIEDQIANFAKVAELRREGGKVFANPSGTATTGAQLVNASALGAGFANSIATGNPAPLLAAAAPMVGARLVAKAVTTPTLAKFAADSTTLRSGTTAIAAGAASRAGNTSPPGQPNGPATFSFEEALGDGSNAQQMQEPVPGAAVPQQDAPPAPAFTSQMRPDGTFAIAGDKEALRAMLLQAGVPAKSIANSREGLTIGRTQAARVQEILRAAESTNHEPTDEDGTAPISVPLSSNAGVGQGELKHSAPSLGGYEKSGEMTWQKDGTLALQGDTKSLHSALVAAGIPSRSLMQTPRGLVVGKSQAANVQKLVGDLLQQHGEANAHAYDDPEENQAVAPVDKAQEAKQSIVDAAATPGETEVQVEPQSDPTTFAMGGEGGSGDELPDTAGSPHQTAGLRDGTTPQAESALANDEQLAVNESPEMGAADNTGVVASIDERAHAAATSPLNDRAEPTLAQQRAGNYALGHDRIAGMDVSIENPQGSVRRGVDADGTPWETEMKHHYGYFKRSTAADGDKLDVFIKPGTPKDFAGPVFVIDQVDPRTGKLDEHKAVLGAADESEAKQIYAANYAPDWKGMGSITRLPLPAFKAWAASGSKKEPLGDLEAARTEKAHAQVAPQQLASAKIDQLRNAGEHAVADLMQKRFDEQSDAAPVASEIERLQSTAEVAQYASMPEFQTAYRHQRISGKKPAESAAFASMLASIDVFAPKIGMPQKAIAAISTHLQNVSLEEAPGFIDRFTQGLIKRGVMQPFEGSDHIGQQLRQTMDTAMNGAVDTLYGS